MKRMLTLACLGILVFLPACASSNGSAGGGERRDRSVIERAEIMESDHSNAFEIVRSLRPNWLRKRGNISVNNEPDIVVYMDGIRAGGPEMLSQIPTIGIERILHYDSREAQFKFGLGHGHGAIEVISRRG